MAKPGYTGLKRIIKATGYSFQGIKACYAHESAFRQEVFMFVVLAPLSLWLGNTPVERALMLGSLFIVLLTELLNTGIEAVVDRVGDEWHELAGRAKDIGSAAVFVSLANVIAVWILILAPRYFSQ